MVSMPHRRPAGRKTAGLALQNTPLRTLLLQTVTPVCSAHTSWKGRGSPGKRCSPTCSCWCWGHFAFWVVLCLPGAVVRAVRLLCPSGTAGVESTLVAMCHARGRKELLALLGWYGLQMRPW
ncbi:MAG: hypothetical protein ACLT29_03155 [Ruminococcus callidus]